MFALLPAATMDLTGEVDVLALAIPTIADVTGPDDMVVGVPDEARDGSVAGWPGGEHPALAVDDNVGTKYLHFKGETEATGFQVAPAMGLTLVTGLTFTTANDATERDPITYELSGSNGSIDGPYELIASGDIVDFAGAAASPRFTMNATPIAMIASRSALISIPRSSAIIRSKSAPFAMQWPWPRWVLMIWSSRLSAAQAPTATASWPM